MLVDRTTDSQKAGSPTRFTNNSDLTLYVHSNKIQGRVHCHDEGEGKYF